MRAIQRPCRVTMYPSRSGGCFATLVPWPSLYPDTRYDGASQLHQTTPVEPSTAGHSPISVRWTRSAGGRPALPMAYADGQFGRNLVVMLWFHWSRAVLLYG